MIWLEALTGTWLDLGTEKLGGVSITDNAISYKAEFQPEELHRMKFSDIGDDHFNWNVDISTDAGRHWNTSVMTIQARRDPVNF